MPTTQVCQPAVSGVLLPASLSSTKSHLWCTIDLNINKATSKNDLHNRMIKFHFIPWSSGSLLLFGSHIHINWPHPAHNINAGLALKPHLARHSASPDWVECDNGSSPQRAWRTNPTFARKEVAKDKPGPNPRSSKGNFLETKHVKTEKNTYPPGKSAGDLFRDGENVTLWKVK